MQWLGRRHFIHLRLGVQSRPRLAPRRKVVIEQFDETGVEFRLQQLSDSAHAHGRVYRKVNPLGRVDIHNTSVISAASQTKPRKFSGVFS